MRFGKKLNIFCSSRLFFENSERNGPLSSRGGFGGSGEDCGGSVQSQKLCSLVKRKEINLKIV
jgi:hypothetical protein